MNETISKTIAISIITYNSAEKLPDCLHSLKSQNYAADLVTVIIVDNNSTDNSCLVASELIPDAVIIKNQENRGFAGANNQAYARAKELGADYLVLLNDDTIVDPAWLDEMVAVAEQESSVAAVQAKLMLWPEKNLINSYGNVHQFLDFSYCNFYHHADLTGEPQIVSSASGAALLLKMSALQKVGLFDDELFMYHEDVDLSWRLRLAGYKLMIAPAAVVYHKYAYYKADYKYYYMERNRLIVALENYKLATLIILAPAFAVMEVGICLIAVKNRWLGKKISGYGWIIGHLPKIWRRHQEVARLRVIGDREILRQASGSVNFLDVDNWLLRRIVNPLMEVYLFLARLVVFW